MAADSRHRRLLANRYQLIDLVGSGAMGQVYRAEDKLLGGVTVAVKFLSQALLNSRMREKFEGEATISALLGERSIHIVKVRDYGVDEKEIPFYVMEFLQGESLSDIIKFRPVSLGRFLKLTRQICFGLECAHQGTMFQGEVCQVVHRDIKPSNILVIQDPTLGELVKILDFGIARVVQQEKNQTQSFMGTLAYCSPEQMEGKELDNRSDIYSLGIMMYEMLTGEMPIFPENSSFGGWYEAHHYSQPRNLNPSLNLPSQVEDLILTCLEKSPSDRPQTISDLLKLLEDLEANQSSSDNNGKGNINNDRTEIFPPIDRDEGTRINLPSTTVEAASQFNLEKCYQMTWPSNKPQQKIVFPNLIKESNQKFPSLWIMLEEQDILNRMNSIRYNQFILMKTPHPMLLWITVLYHQVYGPRWLPCYLDLKTSSGQRFARLLGELESYLLLFFAVEKPSQCQHVMTSTIAPGQCRTLIEWADISKTLKGGQPQITKRLLKGELEKLKPKIVMKLESINTVHSRDLSG
ncbi:MAG: serine/threonine-protein kinase [Microcystaceae cyanobacterium]